MSRLEVLSPTDFETLCSDLMRAETGLRFRVGPPGPDGGKDAIAIDDAGDEHVLQCKHYRASGFAKLRREVVKEAARLKARKGFDPVSYRLFCSVALTESKRKELADLLAPWVTRPDHVYGQSDIDGLLVDHEDVERSHVKLWLSSGAQLQRMLAADVYERSAALLAEAVDRLPRYVQTRAFAAASAKLEAEGVCVIAGPAGVGKTTLAHLLLLDAVAEGAQPFEIVHGRMDDAWRALASIPDGGAIFLFDDFLGQTALRDDGALDADLVRFLHQVDREPKARLVLTTREYVLREADRATELLQRAGQLAERFVLSLASYGRDEKAQIFLNHLWASKEIDDQALTSLFAGRRYLDVIDHPSFTPRVIEWVTGLSGHVLTDEDRADYPTFCVERLSHPDDLWTRQFESGIGHHARALLISTLGLPDRISLPTLETAFERSCEARGLSVTGHAFSHALRTVDDSFVRSAMVNGQVTISLLNPGLVDFLTQYVLTSSPDARRTLDGAAFFEQTMFLLPSLTERTGQDDGLRNSLVDAVQRTFSAPPIAPRGRSSIEELIGENLGDALGRLRALVQRTRGTGSLASDLRPWMERRAEEWLASEDVQLLPLDLSRAALGALVDTGMLSDAKVAKRLLEELAIVDVDSFERFQALEYVRRLDDTAIAPEDWDQHRTDFAAWLDDNLVVPSDVVEDGDALNEIEYLAEQFGVPIHPDQLADLRGELDEIEAERDERRLDEYMERQEAQPSGQVGEDSRSIDALFGPLKP